MKPDNSNHNFDGYHPSSGPGDAYEPSIASFTSSSQSSVFSHASANSSIASSVSDDFRSSQEDLRERDRICAQPQLQFQARANNGLPSAHINPAVAAHLAQSNSLSYADVTSVSTQPRHHPRRSSVSRDYKPPQLVRQRDRKTNFVDNLVDSATQMVEVIWPLSVVPCLAEGGNGRGVLPLRSYIEETLRRSRTSYSTLQVALYYLILIMPLVPSTSLAIERVSDCPANRVLMCGRRMFLAALILASKYLQDRNYSAKAWSKMSGLRICEINSNERTFLAQINWRLHIPKPTFEKWQEVVLRYTPQPACLGLASTEALTWKQVVPLLTPELDTVPAGTGDTKPHAPECPTLFGLATPATTPTPTKSIENPFSMPLDSSESTPTPMTVLPRFLEPKPDIAPPTPALARMGPLPTPQLTPSTYATNTPAASACSSRRPSMCSAMAQAQRSGISRCSLDSYLSFGTRGVLSRRPSLMSTASASSPESLLSDRSRTSRSSSISSNSSIATSATSSAPQRTCLARLAACRNARMLSSDVLRKVDEEGTSASKPIIIIDDDVEMSASPDFADFTVSEKVLHAPHRHSKHARHVKPAPVSAVAAEKRKRDGRSHHTHGGSSHHGRWGTDDEISSQLRDYHEDEMDVDDGELDLDDGHSSVPESDAVRFARQALSRSAYHEEVMAFLNAPSPLANRVAVKSLRGNKRSCVSPPPQLPPIQSFPPRRPSLTSKSSSASSTASMSRLYGEIEIR